MILSELLGPQPSEHGQHPPVSHKGEYGRVIDQMKETIASRSNSFKGWAERPSAQKNAKQLARRKKRNRNRTLVEPVPIEV